MKFSSRVLLISGRDRKSLLRFRRCNDESAGLRKRQRDRRLHDGATGALAFGSYNPFSSTDAAPSAPFSFSINCTRGDTTLAVSVDGGANFANANPSGNRAMKDGTQFEDLG